MKLHQDLIFLLGLLGFLAIGWFSMIAFDALKERHILSTCAKVTQSADQLSQCVKDLKK